MNKSVLAVLSGTLLLAGCVVWPGHRVAGVLVVPALPSIVVLEDDSYQHGGYFYFYQGDSWFYSNSRNGPRSQLPRDRYPKEVQFKVRSGGRNTIEKRDLDGRSRN